MRPGCTEYSVLGFEQREMEYFLRRGLAFWRQIPSEFSFQPFRGSCEPGRDHAWRKLALASGDNTLESLVLAISGGTKPEPNYEAEGKSLSRGRSE